MNDLIKQLFIAVILFSGCIAFAVEKLGVDREIIRNTIKSNEKNFRVCYDNYLKSGGDKSGKITLEWEINDKGDVAKSAAKVDQLQVDSVTSCMKDVLSRIKFESAVIKGQTAVVTFPWVFNYK